MKQMTIVGLAVGLLLTLLAVNANAERLLTEEQALKEMLPGAERVEKVTRTLNDDEVARISKRLGGSLVLTQQGSESKSVEDVHGYNFYFGYKGNDKIGVTVFEKQPGKWGPVSFVVALDANNAKVLNMAVTAYTEKRGRPIALKSFTNQFVGKTGKDPIEVNKDIRAISGATISSRGAAFAVQKVVIMYEEVFLNRPLIDRLKDTEYYATRVKALAELKKLAKSEQDKLLGQLIKDLAKEETSECHSMAIISALTAFANPEMTAKLEGIKFPAKTEFNTNLEETLKKSAEMAGVKLIWASDELKALATQVKVTETIKPSATDNFSSVIESALIRYGCKYSRKIKDDSCPCFTYSLKGDTIEVIDEDAGQKQWQDWWKNYNEKK